MSKITRFESVIDCHIGNNYQKLHGAYSQSSESIIHLKWQKNEIKNLCIRKNYSNFCS